MKQRDREKCIGWDASKSDQAILDARFPEGRDGDCPPCPTSRYDTPPETRDSISEVCDAYWHRQGYDTLDEYQCHLETERA